MSSLVKMGDTAHGGFPYDVPDDDCLTTEHADPRTPPETVNVLAHGRKR